MMIDYHLSADGLRLRYTHHPAADGQCLGPLVFLQGRAEFLEKYADFFEDLAARGFDVWAMDWRGQGGSDRILDHPHKGYVDDFETYLSDLDRFLDKVVGLGDEHKITLIGHSMGGHLALRYVLERPWRVRSLLSMAPMLDIHMPPGLRPISGGIIAVSKTFGWMKHYAPTQGDFNLSLFSFLGNALTHDHDRFERVKRIMRDKPALQLGGVTLGWVSAASRSMKLIRRELLSRSRFPCPAIVLLAGSDRVVKSDVAAAVLSHIDGLAVETVADSRHEISQELAPVRARMWAAVDEVLVTAAKDG